jgi:hypothetical protein
MNLNGDAANNTCHNMSNTTCPIGQGFSSATAIDRTNFQGSTKNDGICTLCVPGQHKSKMEASSCKVCSAGTYQNKSSSGSCINCPKGTFSQHAGAHDCQVCDILEYNPFEGHDQDCYTCLTAKKRGSIQCDGCDPGMCLVVFAAAVIALISRQSCV